MIPVNDPLFWLGVLMVATGLGLCELWKVRE